MIRVFLDYEVIPLQRDFLIIHPMWGLFFIIHPNCLKGFLYHFFIIQNCQGKSFSKDIYFQKPFEKTFISKKTISKDSGPVFSNQKTLINFCIALHQFRKLCIDSECWWVKFEFKCFSICIQKINTYKLSSCKSLHLIGMLNHVYDFHIIFPNLWPFSRSIQLLNCTGNDISKFMVIVADVEDIAIT
jgi:hypothetical protein